MKRTHVPILPPDRKRRFGLTTPRRGVTFIELSIVILILGFMTMLSLPALREHTRYGKLSAAGREFAALARYARQQSVLRGKPVEIHIEFEKQKYYLVLEPVKDTRLLTSSDKPASAMEEIRELPSEKKHTIYFRTVRSAVNPIGNDRIVKIRFNRNGSASASTIVLADSQERAMTIEIVGATGNVRVYEGFPRSNEGSGAETDKEGAHEGVDLREAVR